MPTSSSEDSPTTALPPDCSLLWADTAAAQDGP